MNRTIGDRSPLVNPGHNRRAFQAKLHANLFSNIQRFYTCPMSLWMAHCLRSKLTRKCVAGESVLSFCSAPKIAYTAKLLGGRDSAPDPTGGVYGAPQTSSW